MAACSAKNVLHLDNAVCVFSNSDCKVQYTRPGGTTSYDAICGDVCSIHTQQCVLDSSSFKCIELGSECVHELAEACYGVAADTCLTVNGCMLTTECEAREDVCETEEGCTLYAVGDCHWHGDVCGSAVAHKSEDQLKKQSVFDGVALALWGIGISLGIYAGRSFNSTYARVFQCSSFFCLGALFFLSTCVGTYESIFYATEIHWTVGGIYYPWMIISFVYLICQFIELLEGLYAPYMRIYVSGTILDFSLAVSIILIGGYPAIVLAVVASLFAVTTVDEMKKLKYSLLSFRGPLFGIMLVFIRPHMDMKAVSGLQAFAVGAICQKCISQLKSAKLNNLRDLMRAGTFIVFGIIVFAVVYCLWYSSGYSLSLFVFHQMVGSESEHSHAH